MNGLKIEIFTEAAKPGISLACVPLPKVRRICEKVETLHKEAIPVPTLTTQSYPGMKLIPVMVRELPT